MSARAARPPAPSRPRAADAPLTRAPPRAPPPRAAAPQVDVVSVSAGSAASHAAAVTADGALWTWGLGKDGQLGRGDLATRNVPGPVAAAAGLAGRKVSAVACGARHTLVLLDSGALLSCGSNKYGQLVRPGAGRGASPAGADATERLPATPTPARPPPGAPAARAPAA